MGKKHCTWDLLAWTMIVITEENKRACLREKTPVVAYYARFWAKTQRSHSSISDIRRKVQQNTTVICEFLKQQTVNVLNGRELSRTADIKLCSNMRTAVSAESAGGCWVAPVIGLMPWNDITVFRKALSQHIAAPRFNVCTYSWLYNETFPQFFICHTAWTSQIKLEQLNDVSTNGVQERNLSTARQRKRANSDQSTIFYRSFPLVRQCREPVVSQRGFQNSYVMVTCPDPPTKSWQNIKHDVEHNSNITRLRWENITAGDHPHVLVEDEKT